MHMVHIEDKYIDAEGTYDMDGALADPNGLAILGIFFDVDPKKPQVNQQNAMSVLCGIKKYFCSYNIQIYITLIVSFLFYRICNRWR